MGLGLFLVEIRGPKRAQMGPIKAENGSKKGQKTPEKDPKITPGKRDKRTTKSTFKWTVDGQSPGRKGERQSRF